MEYEEPYLRGEVDIVDDSDITVPEDLNEKHCCGPERYVCGVCGKEGENVQRSCGTDIGDQRS